MKSRMQLLKELEREIINIFQCTYWEITGKRHGYWILSDNKRNYYPVNIKNSLKRIWRLIRFIIRRRK
jgi:hypothetical protein